MRSVLQRTASGARRPASGLLSACAAAPAAPAAPFLHSMARTHAAASFHTSSAVFAAPAKPAAAAAAAPAAGGKAGPAGPPAQDSPRWSAEGWDVTSLVPEVRPAIKTAEEAAADAAELEAAKVLPQLHAEVREKTGSKHAAYLRRQRLRIPGIICDRSAPRQNQLLISMDRFELEQLCRKYRRSVGHRVCLLHVEGQSAPLMVIPDEIIRHAVTQELQVVNWFLFKPKQEKVRVNIPVVFTGADDCIGVKRGGVLVILRDSVPCVWTGDENVPPFIHINLTNADGGKVSVTNAGTGIETPVIAPFAHFAGRCAHCSLLSIICSCLCAVSLLFSFRNADLALPTGLRLFSPSTDYVLATVLGHAKAREEEDETAPVVAAPVAHQPSAIQLEKEKKAKEKREEEEMVAQKLAQKARK